jgi:hypothetical protein
MAVFANLIIYSVSCVVDKDKQQSPLRSRRELWRTSPKSIGRDARALHFGNPAFLLHAARIRGFASPDFSGFALVGARSKNRSWIIFVVADCQVLPGYIARGIPEFALIGLSARKCF